MKQASNPINTTSHKEPASDTQPRIGKWTEIGEVKITQSMFGKVKVQVVTEQNDHLRNWIIIVVLLFAFSVAAWQAWQAWQQPEVISNAESKSPDDFIEKEKLPASQPEKITTAPGSGQRDSKPISPFISGNTVAVTGQKTTSQQTQSSKATVQDTAVSAQQTVDAQHAAQPATEPIPAKVMPNISPVANPSAVPPEKSITASPTPAGNIQPHATPDTKP